MNTPTALNCLLTFPEGEIFTNRSCRGLDATLADFLKIKAWSPKVLRNQGRSGQRRDSHIFARRHGPSGILGSQTLRPTRIPRTFSQHTHKDSWRSFQRKLQGVAKIADKITVCRSMTHGEGAQATAPTTCSPDTNPVRQ